VPVISFLLTAAISMPASNTISIGILDGDKTAMSASIIRLIEKNDSFELHTDITDVEDMRDQLKNQDISIGMRINEGLYDNIEADGSIQLFQTYDIETFKLVELYLNSTIDNVILLKMSTASPEELVTELDGYIADESLSSYTLSDERAKGVFSTTAFGFLMMFMLLVSVLSSKLIADDRFNSTIKRIFISPIQKISYLLAGFLSNFIFQLIQVGVILLICLVMKFEFPLPMPLVFGLLILFGVFASFFGVFIGFISKSVNQMLVMSQMFILPGMLLCGTFFEFELMPAWLQQLSFLFPQTWISQTVAYYGSEMFRTYIAGMTGYIALLCAILGIALLIIFQKRNIGGFY
jgi:ABC-2 type transport system permease protein